MNCRIAFVLVAFAILASMLTNPMAKESEFPPSPDADNVWLLEKNYTDYAYSRPKSCLLALNPGGLAVDELDLWTRTVAKTYTLPHPGYRLGMGRSGRFASVVHNSYITFIDVVEETLVTESFPDTDVPVNGLAVDLTTEHVTCGWIHSTRNGRNTSQIVCVNPTNGKAAKCYDKDFPSYGFTTSALVSQDGSYIYGLTSAGNIVKYAAPTASPSPTQAPRCPRYLYATKPKWGKYYPPTSAWLSYDNSRIFLSTGLTLSTSSDQNADLQMQGSFNGSFAQQYMFWIDQDTSAAGSHEVAALMGVHGYYSGFYVYINRYTWPYLAARSSRTEIPVPRTPAGVQVSISSIAPRVHYYGTTGKQMFAVVNYTTRAFYAPGVAYITL